MSDLTKTELAVLKDLAQGFTKKEIAVRRFRCVDTIKSHVGHILHKVNARNTANAVFIAQKSGLIVLLFCLVGSAFSDVQPDMRRSRLVRSFRVKGGRVLRSEV